LVVRDQATADPVLTVSYLAAFAFFYHTLAWFCLFPAGFIWLIFRARTTSPLRTVHRHGFLLSAFLLMALCLVFHPDNLLMRIRDLSVGPSAREHVLTFMLGKIRLRWNMLWSFELFHFYRQWFIAVEKS
jgi:hypothetical protein